VQLGQLAADRGGPVAAEHGHGVGQAGRQAVRRLEEHGGARLVHQPREPAATVAGAAGCEALEAEPVGRQPGQRQRGGHRRRAGQAGDRKSGGHARRDQTEPRIGYRWHAGVCHHQHGLAGPDGIQQPWHPVRLDGLVVADHPAGHRDPERGGQGPQPAGVLCGHDVGRAQGLDQPFRRVARVAQRGGREHQAAGTVHTRRLNGVAS
jgi:hypothetical protein